VRDPQGALVAGHLADHRASVKAEVTLRYVTIGR